MLSKSIVSIALVALLLGCAGVKGGAGTQVLVNASVSTAAQLGCVAIPEASRSQALVELDAIDGLASVNVGQAYALLVAATATPANSYIWSGLHEVLDKLQALTSSEWVALAQGAIRSAVAGCRAGIQSATRT